MKYEITGRIKLINDTQEFPSGFRKREFVIEELDGQYPQSIKFEATKQLCDKLSDLRTDQIVTVAFNIRGNEYNGKYYVSLQAWKITGREPVASAVEDVEEIPF
jgi:hypothetical protein